MKSMCEIAALIVLLSITGVTTAMADSPVSVTITNNTSYTMTQLYASPSSSSAWDTSTNLLTGGLTVLPGAQLTIPLVGVLSGDGQGDGGGEDSDSPLRSDGRYCTARRSMHTPTRLTLATAAETGQFPATSSSPTRDASDLATRSDTRVADASCS